jgi:hypothetical protein
VRENGKGKIVGSDGVLPFKLTNIMVWPAVDGPTFELFAKWDLSLSVVLIKLA